MRTLHTGAALRAVMLAGLLAGVGGAAYAQTSTDTTSPTGKKTPESPVAPAPAEGQQVAQPPPPPPTDPVASALAPITDFGQTLKTHGIYLQLGYLENFLANVSGGRKTGEYPDGELYVGTVLDLQTIAGIPEASFHITFDERNGPNVNLAASTQGPLSANHGPTNVMRLSDFYWEQGFYKDRIDIVVGRTQPTADFATSLIACNYVSSIICAQPGSWYFSNNNPAYPASQWGARINIAPAPDFYFRAGIYDDDLGQFNSKDNGFNWFNLHSSAGVFVPAEIGYSTDFTSTRYPAKYDVGAYLDASTYQLGNGTNAQSRTAWWVQGQQAIWRPDPKTTQSVTVLGGALVYQGGAPYWDQIYGGAVVRAPVGPSRPNDTLNVIASYYANNLTYLQEAHSNQWIFEVNYGISLYPGITFKPVTQYVIHPNLSRASDAWVVGAQVSIDAGTVLKFPQFVPY